MSSVLNTVWENTATAKRQVAESRLPELSARIQGATAFERELQEQLKSASGKRQAVESRIALANHGGGTIIIGSGSTNVLFRALGPSVPGVPNALQDTTLDLYDSQGSVIATNDNWRDSQAAEIKATSIPPPDVREAAILRQLTPGAYTAVVRGKNNTTGVALVEAYQLN